jgi:endo-1,3-1,4-beta-glycanase ExoK
MMKRALLMMAAAGGSFGCAQEPKDLAELEQAVEAQGALTDILKSWNTAVWQKADRWANGWPFLNDWLASKVTFSTDGMRIDLTKDGKGWHSGEYRTTGFYGYGCYEVSMKPSPVSGVVSALFTYAGSGGDNGGNGLHNEIDVEFVGRDTTRLQANFWTNGRGGHEVEIPLGFDASQSFNRYGFKWTSNGIEWWVNGVKKHTRAATSDDPDDPDPTPRADQSLQKIMMNLWAVHPGCPAGIDPTWCEDARLWAGVFNTNGPATRADFEWVRHLPGEGCSMTTAPPPRSWGTSTQMRVENLVLVLNAQGSQGIAQVTVVDGNFNPVSGAAVVGAWSGLVTGGDTSKITSTDGVATFYSNRTTGKGTIQFCVTSVTKNGMALSGSLPCGTVTR